ncbi:MAG TPA: hypothetical protein VFT82_03810 [Candidatus Paceibacterota bacterium]|nr:hypothetical protein [Candidatus Paceibacterota bacterium]
MAQESQSATLEEVKSRLRTTLHPDMAGWNYSTLVEELRRAIESHRPPGEKQPIRVFTRRHLGLKNQMYIEVKKWLRGEANMTADHMVVVLVTLSKLRGAAPVPFSEKEKGVVRRLVSFIIMSLTSILGLLSEMGVRSDTIDEGDRIEIRRVLKEICLRLGVTAEFPEDTSGLVPVTKKDLAEFGLSKIQPRIKK